MLRLTCLAAAFALLLVPPAAAQFTDDFSDGDFSANPAWTGDAERWSVAPLDGNPALRTDGLAASDTLSLATPSAVSLGTWSFTFAHQGVNLSTFNGARIFLTADTDDLRGEVFGYYLQLGANNSDEVRLYRQDGDPDQAGNRVLLARSDGALLAGDDHTLALRVTRSEAFEWTVLVDGVPELAATDDTYRTSRFFGLWVKHTQAAAQGFFFDDFDVAGTAAPADTTPPALVRAEALDAGRVEVVFSEAVEGCFPERYEVSNGIGAPAGIEACLPEGQDRYVLQLARRLVSGTTYTLTARNIADLAGNVLEEAALSFLFIETDGSPPAADEVVVNEIYYDPPDADLEFVELFNRSDRTFDLSRFALADDRLQPAPVVVRQALVPGGFAVLARNAEAFAAAFPGVDFVALSAWPALNNTGDAVVILFEETVVDRVDYAPAWGGADVSLERKDPGGPSNAARNWASSVDPRGATPGEQNSRFEIDETPPALRFAEEIEDDAVDVFFDEPLAPASVRTDAFALDDGRAPESVFILDEGTRLRLRFADALAGARLTARSLQDLSGNTLAEAAIDLAFRPRPGELIVNEILYDPLADRFDERPDQPEFVELFNRSGRLLSLRGAFRTDAPDEDGTADTLRFGGAFVALAPEGFAVVFADPEPAGRPAVDSKLARAFPEIDLAEAALLPLARAALGLSNGGDLVRLHRADGLALDAVAYAPAWHHPNLRDATGTSLERIAPEGASDAATNWTSSVAEAGATPGRPNSVGLPPAAPDAGGLVVEPSPFSPDRDGRDDVTAIRYALSQEAALVRVRIFDARGRLVRSLEEATLAGRAGQLVWNGLDDAGRALRIGVYVVLFEALDARGGAFQAFKRPVVLARRLD